jgi:hypothetical protein
MPNLKYLSAAVSLLWLLCGTSAQVEAQCADACQLGEVLDNTSCQLWDGSRGVWVDQIDTGEGQLHNRARAYLPWLRELMMPAGGVMSATFADASYDKVLSYGGERDPAIWTGAYLAAEALRYLTTGAPDAKVQMAKTLRVLHRLWNISGDQGNLARFAAPADSAPPILSTLPADDDEVHRNELYEGETWHWRGNVSRDQYQGVMLGYSLAYEAIDDEAQRELIRSDVVAFAEQLMKRERRKVEIITNVSHSELWVDLENVVYSTSDMVDGMPIVKIDLTTQEVEGRGILVFWPKPTDFLHQIHGLGWLPTVELPSQAIQLAAIFRVALQVTEGVPQYAERRQALADYYNKKYGEWLDIASSWENTNDCGDSYHGLNIAFMPMFNWVRLETDSRREKDLFTKVLNSRLWPAVATHKNVFFAFLYASQAPADGTADIIATHAYQLAGFPPPPNKSVPIDLRGIYQESSSCHGLSSVAVDVGQRAPATFLWERQPWKLKDSGVPNRLYGGVDYLLAYWLGRYYGFIEDDAPGTCLSYRPAEADIWLPRAGAVANTSWDFVDAATGLADGIVLTGTPTYHGAHPGVARVRNVSDLGFELRFGEWDYRQRDFGDTSHALEEVPYALFEKGRHEMSDGSVWEVGTFDLRGTGDWIQVNFTQAFSKPPHLFLTAQTSNGPQAVSVRATNVTATDFQVALFEEEALMDGHVTETIGYVAVDSLSGGGLIDLDGNTVPYLLQTVTLNHQWTPVLSQRLRLEEEKSRDDEVGHVDETVHVLALGSQVFAQQVSHNGGDTTALRRLEPTDDAPMEWGLIRGIDHNWQTLPFAKTYSHPVLVAQPASSNGGDPGVIRLRDVTATDAELRYQEWGYLDGWHTREDVFYLVSEAGEHSLGGLRVKADSLSGNQLARAGQWQGVSFTHPFADDPVVLASVMTFNGGDTVTTRIRDLDFSGFDLAMDEQESKADGHVNEILAWFAIETGTATTAEGRKVQAFFDAINHVPTPVAYTTPTTHRFPTLVGAVDSTFGPDPVSLRYLHPTNTQIELRLTEEQSNDTETDHVVEDVGLFVGE